MTFDIRESNGRLLDIPGDLVDPEDREPGEELSTRKIHDVMSRALQRQEEFNGRIYEFLRAVSEELRQDIWSIARAVPGDRNDIVTFESVGDPEKEIEVEHSLGYVPEFMDRVKMVGGLGNVSFARDEIGDIERVYFLTDAPEGTKVTLRIY